ncbi:hypothetical protein HYS95_01725 [Candidatus Daviesbacteria bacterium]|nr:hypothetical protein [Candidatus Daviesbacteria bacterium]
MAPEHIKGTNFVKLLKGERIQGQGGEIVGRPTMTRAEFFQDMIDIQGEGKHIYIEGTTYEDVLQKITEDSGRGPGN